MQTTLDAATETRWLPHPHVLAIIGRIEELTYSGAVDLAGSAPDIILRWLTRFTVDEIMDGVEESFRIHVRTEAGMMLPQSIKRAFHKVPSTAQRLIEERTKPWIGRCLYIQGIARNRLRDRSVKIFDLVEAIHLSGGDLDAVEEAVKQIETVEDLGVLREILASTSRGGE